METPPPDAALLPPDEPEPRPHGLDPHGYAASVAAYMEGSHEMRPHQEEVFAGLYSFLAAGRTRGYVKLPTGTGKTPVFVGFVDAVQMGLPPDRRPKALAATPTKDLAHQTLGRSGKKGFGRFAPGRKVGSFFSDSTPEEKEHIADYDATVTTYRSLQILSRTPEVVKKGDADEELIVAYLDKLAAAMGELSARDVVRKAKIIPTGRMLLDMYKIWVLDEGHRALTPSIAELVRTATKDTVIIAFTATPDADEERQLSKLLPHKIHEMSITEAIDLRLLAPVVPIGVKSGLSIHGRDIYDASGEFIDERIGYLAADGGRNKLIVDAAEVLTSNGVGTIISCIAGNSAWHPQHIAELLKVRGVRAEAVHYGVTAKQRMLIYEQFEAGDIDAITFIGVIAEGWDSERAKGLINARPTRSPIFGAQRPGRISRPGGIAFTLDICDEQEGGQNPPITVADILQVGSVPFGVAVGEIEDRTEVDTILAQLRAKLPILPKLDSGYSDFRSLLASLRVMDRNGRVILADGGKYAAVNKASPNYTGVTIEIVERAAALSGKELKTGMAAQGGVIRTVYHVARTQELLQGLPLIDPQKYYTDQAGNKWLAPSGLVKLFGKRYPDLSEEVLVEVLAEQEINLEWIPARYDITPPKSPYSRRRVVKVYQHNSHTVDQLNTALQVFFAG